MPFLNLPFIKLPFIKNAMFSLKTVVVDQSGQDDEDYQGVLGCTELYCTVLGTSELQ